MEGRVLVRDARQQVVHVSDRHGAQLSERVEAVVERWSQRMPAPLEQRMRSESLHHGQQRDSGSLSPALQLHAGASCPEAQASAAQDLPASDAVRQGLCRVARLAFGNVLGVNLHLRFASAALRDAVALDDLVERSVEVPRQLPGGPGLGVGVRVRGGSEVWKVGVVWASSEPSADMFGIHFKIFVLFGFQKLKN